MIFIIQIRICKLSEGRVMMHINLSRREINLLEDVCYTKLLTIEKIDMKQFFVPAKGTAL